MAATTPFRGEKGVGGYEGGFRVPCVVKWPGVIPANSVSAEFMTMEDWLPTMMARLGQPDLKDKLLTSYKAGGNTYKKIHLDGYDQSDVITGKGPSQAQGVLLLHRDDAARRALRRLEVRSRSTRCPRGTPAPSKARIVAFVQAVTEPGGKDFVAPADRIAVFDNDGTLWSEQPMYFQLAFAIDRVRRWRRSTRSGRRSSPSRPRSKAT
jgi:hypothetical protein